MDIDTLNSFIDTQAQSAYGRPEAPGYLYSGGAEKVWCESKEKAIELFCMEFSTFIKAHPGKVLWERRPHLIDQKVFTRRPGNFFGEEALHCVAAAFEVIAEQEVIAEETSEAA